jgi:hypothetical protein
MLLTNSIVGGSVMATSKQISREQAVAMATRDAGGFLGTWVDASLSENRWMIRAFSKSVNPPVLYVIDSIGGKILYKSLDSHAPIRIAGKAVNGHVEGQENASLITDNGLLVYIDKLDRWPALLEAKRVTVTGELHWKRLVPTKENDTPDYGGQLVMEEAKFGQGIDMMASNSGAGTAASDPISLEVMVHGRGISGVSVPVTVKVENRSAEDITIADACVEASRPFAYELAGRQGKIVTRPRPREGAARIAACSDKGGAVVVPGNSTIYIMDDPQWDEERPIPMGEYTVSLRCRLRGRTLSSAPATLTVGPPELALTFAPRRSRWPMHEANPVVLGLRNLSAKKAAFAVATTTGNKAFEYVFEDVKSGRRKRLREPFRRMAIPDTPATGHFPPIFLEPGEEQRLAADIVFYDSDPLPPGKYRAWIEFAHGPIRYRSPAAPIQVLAPRGKGP